MSTKARLLIVEDEPSIRVGLVDVFVYHGFDVTPAEDGTAGLGKAPPPAGEKRGVGLNFAGHKPRGKNETRTGPPT
ncbi:MAG: response regulator, partial [Pseudomonadota bacterium]